MLLPFHPLVNGWFAETYGKPTAVQEAAWPLIAAGKDVLAVAPTGSGKTLTAFLSALSRFIDGSWDPAELCVLYVSPLKALNEDIRRNLLFPIEALQKRAENKTPSRSGKTCSAGSDPVFRIRAETRSGDTPQSERRRFLLHPPSILAVTPESLAILLLNPKGRDILSRIKCLIIDEIHAVMGTKRGAFLSCQIDLLVRIAAFHGAGNKSCPPFQRIALSATVNPPERAAEFAGGLDSGGGKQKLRIVAPPSEKKIRFTVGFPPAPENAPLTSDGRYGPRYAVLVRYILERIHALRGKPRSGTLLVFTDSRRRAERISYLVNETEGSRVSLCHHGSLSKDVRRDVEQSLVRGLAPCVVATSSLELGLDIGEVDEVILAGTPSSCSRALQRIGRSGHGVGEESRGVLLPFHGMDLLMGAVLAGAAEDREIEKIRPVTIPLDILSQIVLSLCTGETFTADSLYGVIRGFNVFSTLSRVSFDRVIAMLTGAYELQDGYTGGTTSTEAIVSGIRLRELKPRLYKDDDGKLYPAKGTLALLYSSGGVIPSRGLYSMRLADGTKIGELDEEFVFERKTGDSFDFGARSWSIIEIGSEAVIVNPLNEAADFQPFWKADTAFRSAELCKRTLELFDAYNKRAALPAQNALTAEAAAALDDLLSRQKEAQGGVPLPDHNTIPVEIIDDPSLRPDAYQIVFHSFLGGAVHYPLALAVSSLVEEKTGMRSEAISDDNAVLLQLPRIAVEAYSGRPDPLPLLRDCAASLGRDGEMYFKKRLEASGIFGAAFREAAERSMILPRGMFGRRIPLWVMRQRAKRLFDRVAPYDDFPVIAEAWRSCLSDQFDMEGFRALLDGIVSGAVELRFFHSYGASPFARDLAWKETNSFMYEYDARKDLFGVIEKKSESPKSRAGAAAGSLADKAIAGALDDPFLRPVLKAAAVDSFTSRQRRELSGYTPDDIHSLAQWVKDRVAIPLNDEWNNLVKALPFELRQLLVSDPSLGGRLAAITFPNAASPVVVHAGKAALLSSLSGLDDRLAYLARWMSFEGPVLPSHVAEIFGCTLAEAEDTLDALVDTGDLAGNVTLENSDKPWYCDRENYELLLRITRKKARPELRERPAALLVPFTAIRQGLIKNDLSEGTSFFDVLTRRLSCFSVPVKLWETELFPARDASYKPEQLDAFLEEGSLVWFGSGAEYAAFSPPEELDLSGIFVSAHDHPPRKNDGTEQELDSTILELCGSYHSFWEIKDALENRTKKSLSNSEVASALWNAVWHGRLSSDTWAAVRRAIDKGFIPDKREAQSGIPATVSASKLPGIAPSYRSLGTARRLPRALKYKWREGSPLPGQWYSLDDESFAAGCAGDEQLSAIEQEELNMERARLLLRRWGILCRPLLETESLFSWSELLPAMRRMELSGELVTGRFFEGIPSLQFASPQIAAELEAAESVDESPYWMNAVDPASPAGRNIGGLDSRLPARTVSSRLCFRGKELCSVSLKNGRALNIFISPEDSGIRDVLAFLSVPRNRMCHPVKKITLETINGRPAADTAYAPVLSELGFIADRGKMFLW